MNKSQLVWGIVCLALAALLAVLIVVLPPDKVIFMIDDGINAPFIPVTALAVLGIVLIATARKREDAAGAKPADGMTDAQRALNGRLEAIGWGLFLIMLGGFSLVPETTVPKGLWSVGVGLIMLGLNAARYVYGIRMSGFTLGLGIIALVTGIAELFGMNLPVLAILLILLGANLILKPWFEKRLIKSS